MSTSRMPIWIVLRIRYFVIRNGLLRLAQQSVQLVNRSTMRRE
jgi:hypothetical protein